MYRNIASLGELPKHLIVEKGTSPEGIKLIARQFFKNRLSDSKAKMAPNGKSLRWRNTWSSIYEEATVLQRTSFYNALTLLRVKCLMWQTSCFKIMVYLPRVSRPDNIWSKTGAYTSRRTAVTLGLDPEREQDLPTVVDLSSLAFDHSPTYVCRTIYVHEYILQW
jgi:hypothetical protein